VSAAMLKQLPGEPGERFEWLSYYAALGSKRSLGQVDQEGHHPERGSSTMERQESEILLVRVESWSVGCA